MSCRTKGKNIFVLQAMPITCWSCNDTDCGNNTSKWSSCASTNGCWVVYSLRIRAFIKPTFEDKKVHKQSLYFAVTVHSNFSFLIKQMTYDRKQSTVGMSCEPMKPGSSCSSIYPTGHFTDSMCEFCCMSAACNNYTASQVSSACEQLADSSASSTSQGNLLVLFLSSLFLFYLTY